MSTIGPDARWYKTRPYYSPEAEASMLVERNEHHEHVYSTYPRAERCGLYDYPTYFNDQHNAFAALAEALAAFIVADLT